MKETVAAAARPQRRAAWLLLLAALGLAMLTYLAYVFFDTASAWSERWWREGARLQALPGLSRVIGHAAATRVSRDATATVSRGADIIIPPWTDRRPLTFLLLGIDQRHEEPTRSDTIIVLRVDPAQKTGLIISVPRDLYVEIPGYGRDRINESFRVGGPDLTRQVVGQVLGLEITYFAVIDLGGFRRIIDTLGGVEIDVERAINDPLYPDDDFGYAPVYIPAGRQRLNGELALAYARSRNDDPEYDFGRAKRQQRLMLSLKRQFLQPSTLLRVPTLANQLQDTVTTNFPAGSAPSLARLGLEIDESRIFTAAIGYQGGLVRDLTTRAGAMVLQPDLPRVRSLVQELVARAESLPQPSPAPDESEDEMH